MENKEIAVTTTILGAILLIGILGAVYYFGGFKQSIVGTELGWNIYSPLNTQFTSSTYNVGCKCYNGLCGLNLPESCKSYFDSKFWSVPVSYNENWYVTGGDNQIVFTCIGHTYGNQPYCSGYTIKFKDNLYKKHFAVDYTAMAGDHLQSVYGDPSVNILGYSIGEGQSSNGKIEIIPSFINGDQSYLYVNGQKISTLTATNKELYFTVNLGIGASATFTNPRWKPLFDCNVSSSEVKTFAEFSSGSIVNYNVLNNIAPIVKFCVNDPVEIRSLTEGTGKETQNEILSAISIGESYTVNPGQTARFFWVTNSQSGSIPCKLNEALNAQTMKCENILTAPVPDIKINYTAPIEIGEDEFLWTQNYLTPALVIGDITFSPTAQKYTCNCNSQSDGRIYQSTDQSCWSTYYNGQEIKSGTTYKLNDYISIYYEAQGSGVFKGYNDAKQKDYQCTFTDDSDWTNVFRVNINRQGLNVIKSQTGQVIIDNKIANFNSNNAGIYTQTNYLIIDKTVIDYQNLALPLGMTEFKVQPQQELLGNAILQIAPYYMINGKKYFGSSAFVVNYNVSEVKTVVNETLVPTTIYVNQTQYQIVKEYVNQTQIVPAGGKAGLSNTTIMIISIIFLLLAITLIIGIVIALSRRK